MLGDRAASFHEIPCVYIKYAADVAYGGMMDMPANDAIGMVAPRRFRQGRLEGSDEIHRIFNLELGPLRQRPIGKTECPARLVKPKIRPKRHVVRPIAEKSDPAR